MDQVEQPVSLGATAKALYKYVDVAGLRRILDGSIRFTQPSAFNDPFELLPEIIRPTHEASRPFSFKFDLLAPRTPRPSNVTVETIPEGFGSDDTVSREIVEQLNKSIGIFSMSRVRDSLLMWSHYAAQYAGAVVEFDGSHEFFAGQIDVEYRSTRPRRHIDGYLAGAPIALAELCAKSDQWSYEHEVRVARTLSDCRASGANDPRGFPVFTMPIPPEALKGIILGERTTVEEQREIFARVRRTNIELSLAAVDLAGFAFREELIKHAVPISKMSPWVSPRTAPIFSDEKSPIGDIARALLDRHPLSKVVNRRV